MYKRASDKVRRSLNHAIFKRIYVFNEEIIGHELQPHPGGAACDTNWSCGRTAWGRSRQGGGAGAECPEAHLPETELAAPMGGESLWLIEALTWGSSSGQGLNKDHMVGLTLHNPNPLTVEGPAIRIRPLGIRQIEPRRNRDRNTPCRPAR